MNDHCLGHSGRHSSSSLISAFIILFGPGLFLLPALSFSAPRTPAAWQEEVSQNPVTSFVGKKKLQRWNRDKNKDFVDDEIEKNFLGDQRLNIIVDLNEPLSDVQIR